jgi:hypothetical protein
MRDRVSKEKAWALYFCKGESRECSFEVYIDNQSKIVIVYIKFICVISGALYFAWD